MANPIVHRELIGMLRTRRALAVQVALVVVLAALVLLRWPSEARVESISGAEALQVLRVFGYGLLTGIILLAPVFPATSIVREKQQGTLALLLNSPMKSASIVAGKVAGSLGFVLLLLLLSLPAAAACLAMGGPSPAQVGAMYLVLALLALMYTAVGLLISSYAHSTDAALRMTYGVILLLAIVALGPYQFLRGSATLPPLLVTASDWLRCISPIPPMVELMGDAAAGSANDGVTLRFVVMSLIVSAVCLAWTAGRLNQRIFDRSRDAGTATEDRSAKAQAYRRIMYLWFFDPQRRSGPGLPPAVGIVVSAAVAVLAGLGAAAWFQSAEFTDNVLDNLIVVGPGVLLGLIAALALGGVIWLSASLNPVTVKEQQTNRFGRSHWMVRLIVGVLIISLGLILLGTQQTMTWGVEELGGIMVLLQVALIVLVTPSLASGLISAEREGGGWQLLKMTPLSPVSIVLGKLMSVVMTLLLLLLATLPAYGVLVLIDPGQAFVAVQVLTTLGLIAAVALLLSAAISSLFQKTAPATATSYATLVLLTAGTLLVWLAEDAPFGRSTVEAVLTVNPLAAALSLIDAPGFADYQLVPMNWWILGGLCLASLGVLIVQTWRLTRPQ